MQSLNNSKFSERWMLALDCLYHFSPSRRPIFQYASRELHANVAAFDLILNGSAPFHQRLLARLIGMLTGCPWQAFLTVEEYINQIVACGYETQSIAIRDVSNDVFLGLASYIAMQDEDLARYGTSIGGGFRLARKVLAWFGKTGVIGGVIVVAQLNSRKLD